MTIKYCEIGSRADEVVVTELISEIAVKSHTVLSRSISGSSMMNVSLLDQLSYGGTENTGYEHLPTGQKDATID